MGIVVKDGDERPLGYEGFWGKPCGSCGRRAEIVMICYAPDGHAILLCQFHAKQLARKLLEDLCDLAGDRHG